MQVGDILRKKTARVAMVRTNETVAIAAQLMRASNFSALVVKDVVRIEGNTAVGMFTERDVVRAIAGHGRPQSEGFAIDFSGATGLLRFDRYARTRSSSHEQEPHPPSACHRQLQLDWRHQHQRHLNRVRRRRCDRAVRSCLTKLASRLRPSLVQLAGLNSVRTLSA